MKKITLAISGMSCGHCVVHVTNALKELSGVIDATVDLAGKKADITYDEATVDTAKMADAVKEAGYGVVEK
ncbi:MAG: cation transporter [Nitrospirota bacterium]